MTTCPLRQVQTAGNIAEKEWNGKANQSIPVLLRSVVPIRRRQIYVSGSYASCKSFVRYFGASAFAFSMNAAIPCASSCGGAVVRVATGTPTSIKNFS